MSETLYRKYRPRKLSGIVGQDHIKRYFQNAVAKNKVSHAYLLSGMKGIGKTSIARIISLIVNCENGPSVDYDLKSKICKSIIEGSCPDVHELDAGSNSSIDHIREIRSIAKNFPIMCSKRVFIIDECHMLRGVAASALLHVLEEPPESAVFILATIEPHKILPTILSRCQRFDLTRIPFKKSVEYLKEICKKEGFEKVEDGAMGLVAKAAHGSMRDSLTILEPILIQCDKEITSKDVKSIIGAGLGQGLFCDLLEDICSGNFRNAIVNIKKPLISGTGPEKVFLDLLEHAYDMMLAKSISSIGHIYLEESTAEKWKNLLNKTDIKILMFICKTLMKYVDAINTTRRIDIALDTCIIEMIDDIKNGDYK